MTEPTRLPQDGLIVDVADMTDAEIEVLAKALVDWQDHQDRVRQDQR